MEIGVEGPVARSSSGRSGCSARSPVQPPRSARYELDAFWDTVVSVTLRTPAPARDILISMAQDRPGLLLEFELQDEPVVSGLRHVVAALDRGSAELAEDYKLAVFRIGLGVGRSQRSVRAHHHP